MFCVDKTALAGAGEGVAAGAAVGAVVGVAAVCEGRGFEFPPPPLQPVERTAPMSPRTATERFCIAQTTYGTSLNNL